MRFKNEVNIDCPLEKVIALFTDPNLIQHWQDGYLGMKHLEGAPGEEGAKTKLFYKVGKRDMEVVETIKQTNFPASFHAIYETAGMWSQIKNKFEVLDANRTHWHTDNEFRGTRMAMNLMLFLSPKTFQRQSMKMMEKFKYYAEKETQI